MEPGPAEKGGSPRRSPGTTWRTEGPEGPPSEGSRALTTLRAKAAKRRRILLVSVAAGAILIVGAAIHFLGALKPPSSGTTGDPGRDDLRKIAEAQATFRDQDLGGEGKKGFWRGDVAGLHGLTATGTPLRLIDVALASADDRPVTSLGPASPRSPKDGYWFRALRFADEKEPRADRFAACAFPAAYGEGARLTFIVSHEGRVYRKDLGHGDGVQVYPADPPGEGWASAD